MGPQKAVYLLVVEGFADWEPAHAVAELRRHGQYRVESAGLTSATVESMGGLRGRRHTSNGLDYLRMNVPGYAEAANYVDSPAVRDRGLITASGLGDVEFARELFEELNVLSVEDRSAWATIFRSARLQEGAA